MSSSTSPQGQNTPLPPLPSMSSNPVFAPKEAHPANPSSGVQSSTATSYHGNANAGAVRAAQVISPSLSAYGIAGRALSPVEADERVDGIENRMRNVQDEGTGSGVGPQVVPSQSQAASAATEWEMAYETGQEEQWARKVRDDLRGWRGGHGVKRSVYSRQALPQQSYFHQPQTGDIAQHLPKEIIRIERDWSDGEVCQFETSFPMELDSRISATEFTFFVNTLNTHLVAAYSVRGAVVDNLIAVATWWTSLWWRASTFERGLRKVEDEIQKANEKLFNPAGLHVLTPRDVALQFLEIE